VPSPGAAGRPERPPWQLSEGSSAPTKWTRQSTQSKVRVTAFFHSL